jgi:hypothetical protein
LRSETDHQERAEEAKYQFTNETFYKLFDLFIFSSFNRNQRNIVRRFWNMIYGIYEHEQNFERLECDVEAIKDHPNINKLCLATKTKIISGNSFDKQG